VAWHILKRIDITEQVAEVNKVQPGTLKADSFDRTRVLLEKLRLKPEQQQIILPTLHGFDVVKTASFIKLHANGNLTDVYLDNGSVKMICKFPKHFDELPDVPFTRVHRSFIGNTNYIN